MVCLHNTDQDSNHFYFAYEWIILQKGLASEWCICINTKTHKLKADAIKPTNYSAASTETLSHCRESRKNSTMQQKGFHMIWQRITPKHECM